jgi:tight adherence protein B
MSWLGLVLLILAAISFAEFVANVSISRRNRGEIRARDRLRALASRLQDPGGSAADASILRAAAGTNRPHVDDSLDRLPLVRRAKLLLYRAGIATPVWRFFVLSAVLGAAAGVVTLEAVLNRPLAAGAACAAALLPWAFALVRKRRRLRTFELQFPEALDLICRALRAGHALSSGLRMIGEELDDPLAGEFTQLADEVALGLEIRKALANLCHRVGAPDLAFFSTAVLIQRETGGNLAEIMEKLGFVIRERHKFQGKVRAVTAQNRGAAMVLLLTPPTFLLLMQRVSPDFIEPLWKTDAGHVLGTVVLAMTVVGYAVARRLAVVKA